MAFYDLNEHERIALTEAAAAQGRTLMERWTALSEGEASGWSARSRLAASFLAGCASVVDFGCGTMVLERCLASGVDYRPVDVCRRDKLQHGTAAADQGRGRRLPRIA